MDASACPHCGLQEKEALLKAADIYWAEGKQDLAVDYYGRYLALEPSDFDTACKRASYLCSMARERRDTLLFQKADQGIAGVLRDHWDWKAGHQNRVDLYYCFGKLGDLLAEYQKTGERDPARAAACGETIRLIQLVARFQGEKPGVSESLREEDDTSLLVRSFWPLLLAIGLSWIMALLFPSGGPSPDEGAALNVAFLRQAGAVLSLLGTGFYGIWRFQKGRKGDHPPKSKGPRPTLEP